MRLARSIVGEAEAEAVRRVLLDDGYLGMGAETGRFEADLAAWLGVETWQVISVNSGTAALHLACEAVAGPGGEVLVPSLTFVASFQAISAAGLTPVPCDVLPETGTLDVEDAARRLGPRTVAVMPVDYASNPWHLDDVYAFASRHGLRVVEDAAHAFGCRHHGRKIGSFGDLVCFSFDGIKNITSGEGGAVVAFDRADAQRISDARLLAVEGDAAKRYAGERTWEPDVRRQGWRYHLSNIMAAIGRVQLSRLEREFIPARRELAELYRRSLADLPGVGLLRTDPDDYIVPHLQPVKVPAPFRQAVQQGLMRRGIPTGRHYRPNHLLTRYGAGSVRLPGAEELYSQLLSLPLHPGLTPQEVEEVCLALAESLAEARNE